MLDFLLYGILPLLLFVVVDSLSKNLRIAVAAAVCCAAAEMLAMRWSGGRWDELSMLAVALFSICGLVSTRSNNRIYFKYQPVLFAAATAAFIGYMEFFGQPVIYRYLPLLEQSAPPLLADYLADERFIQLVDTLFDWLVLVIILDGILIAYTAKYCSEVIWLAANTLGLWIIGGLMLAAYLAYLLITGTPLNL